MLCRFPVRFLIGLLMGGMVACGPVIQIVNVDVKLPAVHPIHFGVENIAVFNALYDTTEFCREISGVATYSHQATFLIP